MYILTLWRVRGRVHERLTSHQEAKQNRMCSTNLGGKKHSVPCVVTQIHIVLHTNSLHMEHKNEENILVSRRDAVFV